MSALLRNPDIVPALFSRAADPDPGVGARSAWSAWSACSRLARRAPLVVTSAWAAVALIDVPLVKAAFASVGHVLPR